MVVPYNDLNTTSNYIYGRFNVQYVISLSTHHSSEIRYLCLMKCSSETLQNLPYFWNMKTHVDFFIFYFVSWYMIFSLINAMVYVGFSYSKYMANFEAFRQVILSCINPLFMESDILQTYIYTYYYLFTLYTTYRQKDLSSLVKDSACRICEQRRNNMILQHFFDIDLRFMYIYLQ